MYGANPKRPPIKHHDGLSLDIVDIFPTIQGEGPFAGQPAIFVRLGGCNLACDFCDTEFEEFSPLPLEQILQTLHKFARGAQASENPSAAHSQAISLVVITGGEPMRQNLQPLCNALLDKGYKVQIETNGTLFQALPAEVHIVCSPKNTGAGYAPIRADMLGQMDALKFIISEHHPDYRDVPPWCLTSTSLPPIYVQPMDEYDAAKNKANQARAMQLAMDHGYRLSMQLHKILGIA